MWLGDKLQKLKNNINLSGERKGRILSDLLRKIDAGELLREREADRRIGKGSVSIINIFKRMPVFAAILVAALLGGGTSFAAQGSLPGDILYPVKVGFNEKIAEAVQFTPQGRVAIESQIASTRLDEAAKLASQNKLADNWKNVLEANFKLHADAAQRSIAEINADGNSASAASLASDFEASLKARHDVINQFRGSSTVAIGGEINDTMKLRRDAEDNVASNSLRGGEGVKNSAEGKIGAAENVIASAQRYFDGLNIGTSTIADARAKLASAKDIYVQAQAKFVVGDYASALGLAQNAIRTAQEAKISVNLQSDLKLAGPFSVTRHGDDEEDVVGSSASASATRRGGDDRGSADKKERKSGKDVLAPSTSTSTPFKVNVRGDDGEDD
jgi:hypothetical protein